MCIISASDREASFQQPVAVRHLVDMVQDDLYSLIAGIKGFAHYLEQEAEHPADPLIQIIQAADQAEAMMQHIVEYAEETHIALDKMMAQDAVRAAIERVAMHVPDHVLLNINMPQEPLLIWGHVGQLADFLAHLLYGMLNEAGDGPASLRVDTRYNTKKTHIVVALSFEQEGTLAPQWNDFFPKNSAFMYQVSNARAEAILDSHNASWHSQVLDVGYQMTINLPVIQNIPPETKRAVVPMRVLLVEDEPVVAAVTSRYLEQMGHEVGHVPHPQEALALLKASTTLWDMVISDHILPDMHGAALLTHIKNTYPALKTILCSGQKPEEYHGVFLPKPITQASLAAMMQGQEALI